MTHQNEQNWWDSLRHFGLLLSPGEVKQLEEDYPPIPLSAYLVSQLRRDINRLDSGDCSPSEFVSRTMPTVFGFIPKETGWWYRGTNVPSELTHILVSGESLKPQHVWKGNNGGRLPVFIDKNRRIGIGRSRKMVSDVVQWLRLEKCPLAIITNARQWRLVHAGLDFDAQAESDLDLWFEEGEVGLQLDALRQLLQPALLDPPEPLNREPGTVKREPISEAIAASRRGHAELSAVLGERVREAVEAIVRSHGQALKDADLQDEGAAIYRAAVRIVMRMVVVLFAESRDLLPRSNPIYHGGYGLQGLAEKLNRQAARSRARLTHLHSAWPQVLALFSLVYEGSEHEALPVPTYGGDLFTPGDDESDDPMIRALHVFESACFDSSLDVMPDSVTHRVLDFLTRTRVKIRQGRGSTFTVVPVDFQDLSSEYIGILYEGLLDYELRTAPEDDAIIFLAIGNEPALPLSRLEGMESKQIKPLLEKLKDTSSSDDDDEEESNGQEELAEDNPENSVAEENQDDAEDQGDDTSDDSDGDEDEEGEEAVPLREAIRARALEWTKAACEVGGLVSKPRGRMTPENQLAYESKLETKAKQLVRRMILPGEWYLVRWGGTRKGSGTFYTRPQLAVPTVQRTLAPLCYCGGSAPAPPPGDVSTSPGPPSSLDSRTSQTGSPPANSANPLADAARESDDGTDTRGPGSLDATAQSVGCETSRLRPRKPEEVLALKVCDPACGSGSFLVAAVRYLTDALFASLYAHGRLEQDLDRTMVNLLGQHQKDADEQLGVELIPCRPDDDLFEPRLKAVLRRWVVERCIYGVDLDPLAVELCRMSLWIETMDRDLPFSFLDHKIKCGNSLVGTWFDQFMHYPAMAWERDGGDTSHTNGVFFKKEQWTKAIRERKKTVKKDLIDFIQGGRFKSMFPVDLSTVKNQHTAAVEALEEIHQFGINEVDKRAEKYRELRESPDFIRLKQAFDLWCTIWFWPPDLLDDAPMPDEFAAGKVPKETQDLAGEIARRLCFFHWELEFPDVFHADSHGFDAVLGNPPWDISKPNSKEFFSSLDPLYRSYGKQDAIDKQTDYFQSHSEIEQNWLEYCAQFKGMSNWTKFAGHPFGNRVTTDNKGKSAHDFNLGAGGKYSFQHSTERHERWKQKREQTTGYADEDHAFRHQGGGDVNLYKLFLEQAHVLLSRHGRMGMIVPSGVYSDHGTGPLRELFLDHCRWEWLFGFENREGIFDIHRSYKFNPVIMEKGGTTDAIRTAFMRRKLEDWENAEAIAVPYTREQVVTFSPYSKAILEIQSEKDLEVLTRIYANSVLLGDNGPDGWGIKYATEFHMTNDSKLFPPRPKWEEWGYRPDEYSRWIKGPWRPIEELWQELNIDPTNPDPPLAETPPPEPSDNNSAVNDSAIKTSGPDSLRVAQPPYDKLSIPRADIPAGIILSRDADAWIREDEIPTVTFTDANGKPLTIKEGRGRNSEKREITGPAVAIPIYQGSMIWILDFAFSSYDCGAGNRSQWKRMPWSQKKVDPQFLLPRELTAGTPETTLRWVFRDISNATNQRTFVTSLIPPFASGNKTPLLKSRGGDESLCALAGVCASLPFDWAVRRRMTGTTLNFFIVEELPVLPFQIKGEKLASLARSLNCSLPLFAPSWLINRKSNAAGSLPALMDHERLRLDVMLNAIVMGMFGLDLPAANDMMKGCDFESNLLSRTASALDPKGFWRVDKDKPPEQRLTVLSLVAFHDLQAKIDECDGYVEEGIEAFCTQNDGEGWMLPETLRLADYGLGHDERAQHPQPVRECFGPRFHDWQLAQSPEESWKECHLHARNLLGGAGYQQLLAEIEGRELENSEEQSNLSCAETVERDLFGNPLETDLFGQTIRNSKKGRRW